MEAATAVLLNYKRPDNLPQIISHLKSHEWITEIIVWDNAPDVHPSLQATFNQEAGAVHLRSSRNYYTYGRFIAASIAQNPIIVTQDDDVANVDYNYLYDCYVENNGIHMCLDASHYSWGIDKKKYQHTAGERWTGWEGLVGYGAILPRKGLMHPFEAYQKVHGLNDPLMFHKADRIYTILSAIPHWYHQCSVVHLPKATDRNVAMYRQPDHLQKCREAVRKCKEVAVILDLPANPYSPMPRATSEGY